MAAAAELERGANFSSSALLSIPQSSFLRVRNKINFLCFGGGVYNKGK